jgi:hypothetical protein
MPNYILRKLEYKQLHTDKNLMREFWRTTLIFFYTPLVYNTNGIGVDKINKDKGALYTDFVKNVANYNNEFGKTEYIKNLKDIQPPNIAFTKAYFIICRKFFNTEYLNRNGYALINIKSHIAKTLSEMANWKEEYKEKNSKIITMLEEKDDFKQPIILDDFITKFNFLIKSYFTSYLNGCEENQPTIIDIISNKDNLIDDFTEHKTAGGDFDKINNQEQNIEISPLIKKNKLPLWLTIIIIVGITLVLITIIICLCCFIGKKRIKHTKPVQKETYTNLQMPVCHYRKIPNGYGGYNTQIVNKPNKFSAYGV